jgi:hypothetical protein
MHREIRRQSQRCRIVIIALALLLAGLLPAAAEAADALYDALLKARPQKLPAGISLVQVGPGPIDQEDQNAGMMGNAQITLQGTDPKAKINYLLFPDAAAANAYLARFERAITQNKATLRPLANLPAAKCAETVSGAACAIDSGRIAIFSMGSKVEGSAGPLLNSAIDHLNDVIKANGLQ